MKRDYWESNGVIRIRLGEERNVHAILSTKGTEDIAQPGRNGYRGSLGFAIDIATRYRKSRIKIDSESRYR